MIIKYFPYPVNGQLFNMGSCSMRFNHTRAMAGQRCESNGGPQPLIIIKSTTSDESIQAAKKCGINSTRRARAQLLSTVLGPTTGLSGPLVVRVIWDSSGRPQRGNLC